MTLNEIFALSQCPMLGCPNRKEPAHIMCNHHWLMQPKRTRRRLWRWWASLTPIDRSDHVRTLTLSTAEREIKELRLRLRAAESRAASAESTLQAYRRDGPGVLAAAMAAQMAVSEMMARRGQE